jgi:hypothetical protein
MSKVIKSPVKRFPGEVTLSDPLTFPQVFAIQDALAEAGELGPDSNVMRYNRAILPGVLECVEKWGLKNFPKDPTPDTFPATPSLASANLVAWLISEISELFNEAEPDPEA